MRKRRDERERRVGTKNKAREKDRVREKIKKDTAGDGQQKEGREGKGKLSETKREI